MGTTWNDLIHLRDKAKNMLKDDFNNDSLKEIEERCERLLSQINTSSGRRVIEEANNYIASLAEFKNL